MISTWNREGEGEGGPDADENHLSLSEADDGGASVPPRKRRRQSKQPTQDEDRPACQYCRKKKSACSRTQPCSTCVRYNVDCVYYGRKAKPGVRPGAMESLNQRVDALEKMFIGQGLLFQQVLGALNGGAAHNGFASAASFEESIAQLRTTISGIAADHISTSSSAGPREHSTHKEASQVDEALPLANGEAALPASDLMDALIDIYFDTVHPWIPMLHVHHFRLRASSPSERPSLSSIFYAITSLCARFSSDPRLGSASEKAAYTRSCRQIVILRSMESFSVENLQALTICAFDLIGGGRGPSAWSIVGSMTRTVEHLRLSVEDEAQPMPSDFSPSSSSSSHTHAVEPLIKRMTFLPRCTTWSGNEERRRVFWNIFTMDRFCSIATGWNFSLTSADVKRRLPCEGALWERGQPPSVAAPYFGVVDQASRLNPPVPAARPDGEDQALLGGFAFCIEATESLSLVTSFFLQYELDLFDSRQVQIWLMRFKQLDLRLVQWKVCLPERWREACVLNADGNMDPNLTLAHMTHNTAVILLHQVIAFPPPASPLCRQLATTSSSPWSAETCLAAATEVATIAHEFLQRSPRALTSPQFAFCLFICGRLLLAHTAHQQESAPPPRAFDSLVASLLDISQRWNGPSPVPSTRAAVAVGERTETQNLASKFAVRLVDARCGGARNMLDIRDSVFSEECYLGTDTSQAVPEHTAPTASYAEAMSRANLPGHHTSHDVNHESPSRMAGPQETSPDSISMAFPPLPLAFQDPKSTVHSAHPNAPQTMLSSAHSVVGASLYAPIPEDGGVDSFADFEALLDPQFATDQRISVFSHATNAG